MDIRTALFDWRERHALDARAAARLEQLAGLRGEPPGLARRLPLGVAVLGIALLGFGLILWIAANWDTLSRAGRFALLQGVVLVALAGALLRPALRAPLALLGFLGIGGLFAYFGQTYQTGADPWQLFALWAALALPLALAVRSDLLWAPWALVAAVAISLWVQAHTGHSWRVLPDDLRVHLAGWGAALALVGCLSAPLRGHTGAGPWALRTALTLTITGISATALGGLFGSTVTLPYPLGLLVLAAMVAALALRDAFDVYGLSAAALGLNVLLIAGLARLLFHHHGGGEPIGQLLLLGLVAAGLLAGSVSGVLRLARQRAGADGEGA